MPDYTLIDHCQLCQQPTHEIISLGHLPLVDGLIDPSSPVKKAVPTFPTPLLFCPSCSLVQLGCLVDPTLLFPADYPYTSSTTAVLRNNFHELAAEAQGFIALNKQDLVIDIGCNDGTLLANFTERARTLGVTPENMANIARQKGIEVIQSYFTGKAKEKILTDFGQAKIVTATNVLAHFIDIHEAVRNIKDILHPDGIFISESGYFPSMLQGLQYDSIHHEHMRYYTLTSLKKLFDNHGLEIIHVKIIPTHGGSIRVYAARPGSHAIRASVTEHLTAENKNTLSLKQLNSFRDEINQNRISLAHTLNNLKKKGHSIAGIGAPGRATALLNYANISKDILPKTFETEGSYKIGKSIPGVNIFIEHEALLYKEQPDYALILSWHFAQELIAKIRSKGFKGRFIVPLPKVSIIEDRQ